MAENFEVTAEFLEALDTEDWDRVEELWLEALDDLPISIEELFEVRRLVWKAGRKNLARTLLELLADSLDTAGSTDLVMRTLRELTRLADGKPTSELLERVASSLSTARSGKPSLKAVLAHHDIAAARRPLEELDTIERWLEHDVCTAVEVVGQGVGRVVDLNLELGNIKVDIGTKRPISVPIGAVDRYLKPLPEGDFRRHKVEDPEGLAKFVAESPGEALVQVLESLGQPSNVSAIKAAMDGVLDSKSWTSWWAKARKHPRVLSSGTGSRLRYAVSQSAEAADETLLDELRSAALSEKPAAARRLADRGPETAGAASQILQDSLAEMEVSDLGLAWQTAGILAGLPNGSDAAVACRQRLIVRGEFLPLLSGVNDRTARTEALLAIAEAAPDQFPEVWADWLLHEDNPQNMRTIATRLEAEGYAPLLDRSLEAIFRNHVEHAAQFLWACEFMAEDDCPATIRSRMTPSLLEKLPDTLTRREFSSMRSRAKGLLDGGQVAVRVLMESASARQAERFSQRIARIDAVEPQRVRLVEQAAQHMQLESDEPAAPILVATKGAAEAKQEELRTLLEQEIPKTLKGINAAAAEGDLRENFEYHMLRDRQELQSARAAKLQEELAVVRILEPGAADTSTVNIGTVVYFEPVDGNSVEPITILGAWDSDLDRRVFANGSDLVQKLLGAEIGEEVEIDEVTAAIKSIDAWKG